MSIISSGRSINLSAERKGIFPYPGQNGYFLSEGERSDLVSILQLMINALNLNYDLPHVVQSGEYDALTIKAVKLFQKMNLLEETGNVNGETWDRLAEEYNITVNDNQ